MKTLAESLFDKDLVSKDLDIMKVDFNEDSLAEMSVEDRNALFDTLFELGEPYNAAELRAHPIDLNKHMIIARVDKLQPKDEYAYPVKYRFIYNSRTYGDPMHAALHNQSKKVYYWDYHTFSAMWKQPTWKGQVAAIYSFLTQPSFSVLTDEKLVSKIVKGIQG